MWVICGSCIWCDFLSHSLPCVSYFFLNFLIFPILVIFAYLHVCLWLWCSNIHGLYYFVLSAKILLWIKRHKRTHTIDFTFRLSEVIWHIVFWSLIMLKFITKKSRKQHHVVANILVNPPCFVHPLSLQKSMGIRFVGKMIK